MNSETAKDTVQDEKLPWEPITVTVYNVRDTEFGAGTLPDGSSIGSNPS